MRYRAFISYSHKDRKQARWLHRALESYRVPPALKRENPQAPERLSPVFRDLDELPSTSSLPAAVSEALAESEWLIVICSPDAASSHWVNEEIRTFRELGRSDRILSFVVDGVPESTAQDGCFPPALTAPEQAGGKPTEPVAADARPGGDGRKNALLRIAAGMLGVGFDALRQRDSRRRHRKMVAITAGSFVVAAVTIVLAINAVIARNEAQVRRAQAENLIAFMLGDLTEHLREIGRLDVFQSVGDKALEYFAAQREEDDDEHTLLQRAKNLRQIGDVRLAHGNFNAALNAFNEALLITERFAAEAPHNSSAQVSWANSLYWIGYTHWQHGELNEATAHFEKVVTIIDQVSAAAPDNPAWLAEKVYAYTNLGRVLEQKNNLRSAHDAYTKVMQANQRLVALEPGNTEWVLELGFAHNNLGKLMLAFGRLQEAETHYRKDLEIKKRVLASNPNHNTWRDFVAVSQYFLGQMLIDKGALEEASSLLNSAKNHFVFLRSVDAQRWGWAARLANIERELGVLHFLQGNAKRSNELFTASVKIFNELLAVEENNFGWRRDLVRSLVVAADVGAKTGADAVASFKLEQAGQHLNILLKLDPHNREILELVVYAEICRAQLLDGAGSTEKLHAALDTLDRFFASTTNPRVLDHKAAILAALNRQLEASEIRENLRALGYQGRRQHTAQKPAGSG